MCAFTIWACDECNYKVCTIPFGRQRPARGVRAGNGGRDVLQRLWPIDGVESILHGVRQPKAAGRPAKLPMIRQNVN